MNKPHYSLSKVQKFQKCKYAYYLSYVKHLEPVIKSEPLTKGSIIHEVLANWYITYPEERSIHGLISELNVSWGKRHFDHWEDKKAQSLYNTCKKLLTAYFKRYGSDDKIIAHSIEHLYSFELFDYIIDYKTDMLFYDGNNCYWLMETKTGKPDLETLVLWEPQGAFYTYLIREHLELDCNGVLYNLIPDSGEIEREWIDYTEKECKNTMSDICNTIEDMEHFPDCFLCNKTRGFSCKWCEYSTICHMETLGLDTQNYIEENYEIRNNAINKSNT